MDELLKRLGGEAIPFYAVFRPDAPYQPLVFDGLLTPGQVQEVLEQAASSKTTATSQRPQQGTVLARE